MSTTNEPLLPRWIDVSSIPVDGTRRAVTASPAERAAIAAAFGLLDLRALSAEIELFRGRKDAVTIEGRVTAEITQACVVTLDPVDQSIDEPFALRLVPNEEAPAVSTTGGEIVVDALGDDPPDAYSGDRLDFGAIVLEHFALAIDPYPRAPGAELPGAANDTPEDESPFAALAALKHGGQN